MKKFNTGHMYSGSFLPHPNLECPLTNLAKSWCKHILEQHFINRSVRKMHSQKRQQWHKSGLTCDLSTAL
uniref:Uncharacterized protein n=2 Tax=Anguilla anguilla TaxID=7936 RepID=A0A0E9PNK1_ANGAN